MSWVKGKRVAVVSSSGVGDALIFSIAAHHLKLKGATVVMFHHTLPLFGRWLEEGDYRPLQSVEDLFSFDLVILQQDNSERAKNIAAQRTHGLPLSILYPTYRPKKHGPLKEGLDFAFDEECSMVDNLCLALARLFNIQASKKNALRPPSGLVYKKYPSRIAIHPTSGNPEKNWPKKNFLRLADSLRALNLHPYFILPSQERSGWPKSLSPQFADLEAVASFIYESGAFIGNDSGPGHLASYLSIPHIILADQERRMKLWRPGWMEGTCLFPPKWIPNWKGSRWREHHWTKWISKQKILDTVKNLYPFHFKGTQAD